MNASEYDPNIWKELHHGGRVPREWRFVGVSRGVQCNIPVQLTQAIDHLPGYYWIHPLAAMHVLHCPDAGEIGRNLIAI